MRRSNTTPKPANAERAKVRSKVAMQTLHANNPPAEPKSVWLIIEFFAIFIAVPLLYLFKLLPNNSMIPLLWGVFLYSVLILKAHRVRCFYWDLKKSMLLPLFWRASAVCAALICFTLLVMPQNFLAFVRHDPMLWLLVMLLYPILSAFTQETIFRRFFFFRYRTLWHNNQRLAIVLSALLFSYMHIVFLNYVAVLFTLVGGLIFATQYLRHQSLILVSLEHAIYGNIVFTVGLGAYFYHAAI
ncbi:CPBP family intramembrane glutamic endopeptidase [Pasteurella testudinis]|uniref:CPBP family intramembrane glutamic endopeptidase n=1 Tax=Pasteurella testudinis TaxID=761 RepID=UPI004059F041